MIKLKLHTIKFKQSLILLGKRILRLLKDIDKCLFIQHIKCCHNRYTAYKLGDKSELYKILR